MACLRAETPASAVILESNRFDASIFGKKPTLVIGGEAMQKLEKLGVLAGFDAEKLKGGSDYEGLMKAIIDDQDSETRRRRSYSPAKR